MNRSFALLLTVVMVAHSLAGCCCHHAHAAEADRAAACSHAEHGHEPGEEHDQSTPTPQPCGEQECVFVRGDGGPAVDLVALRAVDQALVMADCPSVEPISRTSWWHVNSVFAPPERLHLLHQILLI